MMIELHLFLVVKAIGTRNGELSLRRQRFSPSMLHVLQTEQFVVEMSVTDFDAAGGNSSSVRATGTAHTSYAAKPNCFVLLEAQVWNNSSEIVTCILIYHRTYCMMISDLGNPHPDC